MLVRSLNGFLQNTLSSLVMNPRVWASRSFDPTTCSYRMCQNSSLIKHRLIRTKRGLKRASGVTQQRIFNVTTPLRGQRRIRPFAAANKLSPVHQGKILLEDFIEGFGITQHKLAVSIGVPPRLTNEIVMASAPSLLIQRCVWAILWSGAAVLAQSAVAIQPRSRERSDC